MKTDTPETDAEIEFVRIECDDSYVSGWAIREGSDDGIDIVPADFARKLERERDDYKKQAIAGYKLLTDLQFWRDMPTQEMQLRCGEIRHQEMRAVRAVLAIILATNSKNTRLVE